jgi:hypothetical protein
MPEAIENLNRIKETYKDDPELLAFYEPSALWLVEQGGEAGERKENN